MKKTRWLIAACLLAATLTLSACGGEDKEPAAPDTQVEQETEAPEVTDAPDPEAPTEAPEGPSAPTEGTSAMEKAASYIGSSVSKMLEDPEVGSPSSQEEDMDPATGATIRYYYYDGFTVYTVESEDGTELVEDVM